MILTTIIALATVFLVIAGLPSWLIEKNDLAGTLTDASRSLLEHDYSTLRKWSSHLF